MNINSVTIIQYTLIYLSLTLFLITVLLGPCFFLKIIFQTKYRKYLVWLTPFVSTFTAIIFLAIMILTMSWLFDDDMPDTFLVGFGLMVYFSSLILISHVIYTFLVYIFLRWDEKQRKHKE